MRPGTVSLAVSERADGNNGGGICDYIAGSTENLELCIITASVNALVLTASPADNFIPASEGDI